MVEIVNLNFIMEVWEYNFSCFKDWYNYFIHSINNNPNFFITKVNLKRNYKIIGLLIINVL